MFLENGAKYGSIVRVDNGVFRVVEPIDAGMLGVDSEKTAKG